MAATIDYQLRDSWALNETVDSNLATMKAKGFSESNHTQLTQSTETLRIKEAAQQKAVKLVTTKVTEQDNAIEEATNLIRKIRNAAKSAYGKDERKLKVFKCDQKIPTGIGQLITAVEYLASVVLEEHEVLIANGITQEEIDVLNSTSGKLVAANASRESAGKLQQAATLARDEAAAKLKDKVFRVRNFAKACFAGNKEILLQFKPIPKGASGGKTDEGDGGTETPPENPAPGK